MNRSAWGLVGLSFAAGSFAQPVPLAPVINHNADGSPIPITHEQGYEFVTVHDPAVTPSPDVYTGISASGGAASYAFRISRTETTNGQWFEFLTDYAHWFSVNTNWGPNIFGLQIHSTNDPAHPWAVVESQRNAPTITTWRMAAMYCNWLCHDQADTREAFLTGAYNVSTFGYQTLPGGITMMTDQLTHTPGARYWIPTFEELTTAMHWDPNRYGAGQGGWWQRGTMTDTVLPYHIARDEEGYDIEWSDYFNLHYPGTLMDPVASYQFVQSPWGLFDTAGGVAEYTEGVGYNWPSGTPAGRYVVGSSWTGNGSDIISVEWSDNVDWAWVGGLRIAASVPAPSSAALIAFALALSVSRRR